MHWSVHYQGSLRFCWSIQTSSLRGFIFTFMLLLNVIICVALSDLVPFVQFKKRRRLKAEACNFTKINTPPWVFFTFFKLYQCYQMVQRITYSYIASSEELPKYGSISRYSCQFSSSGKYISSTCTALALSSLTKMRTLVTLL